MKKIIFSCLIVTSIYSCAKNLDKSYETIKNDPLYSEYYSAFIESSEQALKFDNIEINKELKACGLYNDRSVCDPLPDCGLSKETIQWFEISCKVFKATNAVKEKYGLTTKEFINILNQHIDENFENYKIN